jgi:hypothetical protein
MIAGRAAQGAPRWVLTGRSEGSGAVQVPLLDLAAQLEPLRDRILAAVGEVLASGRFVLGPKMRALEAATAERLGVEHAISVSSGTDALVLSLLGLGVGAGDLVVTSAYSFFATAIGPSSPTLRSISPPTSPATCTASSCCDLLIGIACARTSLRAGSAPRSTIRSRFRCTPRSALKISNAGPTAHGLRSPTSRFPSIPRSATRNRAT